MKIVLIGTVASSFYGFRADLIHTLLKQGHKIYAFTSEYRAEDLKKIEQLGAIPVTYTLNRGGLNPLLDIFATYQLSKKLKAVNPDLVFSYFSKPVIFGTLAAKLAKVPRIIGMLEGLGYTFTEQPEGYSKKAKIVQRVQVALFKLALPLADKVIFLNPDDPIDLLKSHHIGVKKIEVLGGIGLNPKDYPYRPVNFESRIRFLFIARLIREKGIFDFVEAAKIVKKTYPNAIFTVLGGIDEHAHGAMTKFQLDELIQSNIIEYPGRVNNVSEWLANSHVFVLPSYYREGVPRSTQEAMAVGRAVITTDVPGCRETVIDGKNGFIVPKWNPQALAEKMVHFIENPEQIQAMGEESYKIAQEKFDARKVNERLLKILGV